MNPTTLLATTAEHEECNFGLATIMTYFPVDSMQEIKLNVCRNVMLNCLRYR